MRGLEAHFVGKLTRGAELRRTKAGKEMVALLVAIDTHDGEPAFCSVLLFEDQAERLAGLPKGTEVYARGRLKAALYQPEGGEPRVSLTLLATHVEPMTLERKASKPRPPAVYGDRTRKPSTYARPARGGEDFNDAL